MDFPKQNIPDKKKTKKWCKDVIDAIINYESTTSTYSREKKKDYDNYLFFNGIFDPKNFEYVTQTYGITSPARLVNYPIIQPKIDLLAGEFLASPLHFTVSAINEDAVSRKLDKKLKLLVDKLTGPIIREIEEEVGIDLDAEMAASIIPDDIDEFMRKNYRENVEDMVYNGLNYLISKDYLKASFKRGFYDLAITAKEFYQVSIRNGNPFVRRVDPRNLIWNVNTESETIQDSAWVAEERFLTINEIVDEYSDFLSNEQIGELEELRYSSQQDIAKFNKPYQYYYTNDGNDSMKIRVIQAEWKSLRTLKFKLSENPHEPDVPFRKMLRDDYKPKKRDNIEKRTVNDIWEAIQIGHDMIIKNRRRPNQIRSEQNYAVAKLSYIGVIKNNIDGMTLSLVDAMKNVQLLYNIVMYQIELAMARSGGKAVVYDVAQKPSGMGVEDVLYHAKNSGIIVINSKQEGNQMSTFNQFQQIDYTLSNSVQQLVNLKVMLEQTADQITGINQSRAGFQKTDAVGVNERAVMQSSLITRPLFDIHSQTIEMVFNGLADLMKVCWNKSMKMSYILGDTSIKMFEITDEISMSDYGIFVTNSSKDFDDKKNIQNLAFQAISSGAVRLEDMIKIINAESSKDAEIILEKGVEEVRKQEQANMQMQAQAQQEQAMAEQQKAEIDYKKSQESNQTKVQVAQIEAEAMIESTRMKIEKDETSQEFSQNHNLDLEMLKSANEETKEEVVE